MVIVMCDKSDSRRSLLKSIVAGSSIVVAGKSVSESWGTPVINSVILPAHAATTDYSNAKNTETVPCCSIMGEYCGSIENSGNQASSIELAVRENGEISISIDSGEIFLNTLVACSGGGFTATERYIEVTGTVVCGATQIEGFVTEGTGDQNPTHPYTALRNRCEV